MAKEAGCGGRFQVRRMLGGPFLSAGGKCGKIADRGRPGSPILIEGLQAFMLHCAKRQNGP